MLNEESNELSENINTIIKSNSGHIYVDTTKNILNLEILNEKYNHEEFVNLCEILKHFFKQAYENKIKYFLIFHTQKLGMYPLKCYEMVKKTLEDIKPLLIKILHSTCVMVEPNFTSHILKFFFSIYKPVRPAKVITSLEEAEVFFNMNKNMEEL